MKKYGFHLFLFILLFSALAIRVFALGRVPMGMTDDELRETYCASSLWHTGRALSGETKFPFLFIVNNFSFNPIPIYITAPFVGIFGVSMATARLPYALAGFLTVVGMYLVVRRLTGNTWIALGTAFCLSFNVWAVQLSRIAYEAGFALLFYVWGTHFFLQKKYAIAMGIFFLAFNSYDAMKFLYMPLLFVLSVYQWKELKQSVWIVITLGVAFTMGVFALTYMNHLNVRGSQFTIFQNTQAASAAVQSARNASLAPGILPYIFHNNITYFTDVFLRHFLYTFSMEYLFFNQEASGIFSLWLRGSFYILELPFLLLGVLFMFLRYRRVFVLSIAAMLIGAIPAGIGPEPFSYATRASFSLPWIALFVGAGIVYALELTKKHWTVMLLVGTLYVYSIAGYLNQYYFEWSKNNAVYFSKGVEDLARYLAFKRDNRTVEIANMTDAFILHWALVTKSDPKTITGVIILPSCKKTLADMVPHSMYAANPDCHKQKPDHLIVLPDGTPQWAIYVRE